MSTPAGPGGSGGWLAERALAWRALGAAAGRLRRRQPSVAAATEVLDGYRVLARDLATARRLPGAAAVARGLETLYVSYHSAVTRPAHNLRASLVSLVRDEVPAITQRLRATLGWIVLLFAAAAFAGWWLITTYPLLISLVASDEMIRHVENGELWTDDLLNVTPSSLLSLRILSNNIVVSIATFCAGLFYGLGTVYMIALNGFMLGAVFAFTHQYGIDDKLLSFVMAHGPVELSVICVAGAAGVSLGDSLVRPDRATRRESFEHRSRELGRLLLVCALLLVGCGIIEGFVSPDARVPMPARVAIGLGYWALMLALLSGRLFRRRPG
jgi:uncharacterized membrane protein SpoIIM required for sporulation